MSETERIALNIERIMDLRYRDLTEDDKRVLDEMNGEDWDRALAK